MFGYFSLFTNVYPGVETLVEKTTSYCLPSPFTFIVHVVLPLVWPGVRRAVNRTSPSSTRSPSRNTRSTLTGL
jgi:hypothetical protein